MRVRVISVFRDKYTHEIYNVGAEREFDEARAKHLLSLGLVEAIAKPKPAKEEVKVEEKPAEPAEPKEATAEVEPKEATEEKKEPAADTDPKEPAEPQQKVVSERRRTRKTTK